MDMDIFVVCEEIVGLLAKGILTIVTVQKLQNLEVHYLAIFSILISRTFCPIDDRFKPNCFFKIVNLWAEPIEILYEPRSINNLETLDFSSD